MLQQPQLQQQPRPLRAVGEQDLFHLRLDPLPGHPGRPAGVPAYGRQGGVLDRKIQLGGKTHRPQHPQRVLGKAPVGVPDAADLAAGQVRLPAGGIDHLPLRRERHGVDGEIPAGEILRQSNVKAHPVRTPPVGVAALPPEGGHLHRPALRQDGDGSVAQARGKGTGKQRHDLLRPGGGAHIVIPRRPPQQQVAHASPHRMGLAARAPQGIQQGGHPGRNGPAPHFFTAFWYLFLAIRL